MMVFTFVIVTFLIINFIHRTFVVYKYDIGKAMVDYFNCVFLYPEKNCPRALPFQQLIFVRLLIERLNLLIAMIGILVFFSADKNFRSMWRKAIRVAISRREKTVLAESSGTTSSAK